MQNNGRKLTGHRFSIALLFFGAFGAIFFSLAAGYILYFNTQRLSSAAERVEHTQQVLAALQRGSMLADQAQESARLYSVTGDSDALDRARSAASLLRTDADQLRSLVSDNPQQTSPAQQLVACSGRLDGALAVFTPQTPAELDSIPQCKQAISLMSARERALLSLRNQGSANRVLTSVSTEIFFIGLSILALLVLFGFLLRDAFLRQSFEQRLTLANSSLSKSVQDLENRAFVSSLLTAVRDELQLCTALAQVYTSVVVSLGRLLPGTAGRLFLINHSRTFAEVVGSWGNATGDDFSPLESCCGLRSGKPRWRIPGSSEIHCTHFAGTPPERYLCLPVVSHGEALGILCVQCPDAESVDAVNLRMDGLRELAQIAGMAIASLNLRLKLEHQSIRDPLTGLFNRNFMQLSMEREMARARRRKQVMAVLMLDLDHFKRFNDTHGHAAGDAALKAAVEVFRANIRAEDIACRYGGEEFAIILPDTTVDGACDKADLILKGVASMSVASGPQLLDGFSVSIGLAFFPGDGESPELLLQHADAALYRAKHSGRNQYQLYETAFAKK